MTDDALPDVLELAPAADVLELPLVGSELPPDGLPAAYRDEAGNVYRLLDSDGSPVVVSGP